MSTDSCAARSRVPSFLLASLALAAAGLVGRPEPAAAQLGLKGGLSYATRSDNARPDLDSRTGFAAGLSLPLGRGILALQPEGLYVERGWEGTAEGKLTYIEVPLLLRVNIPTPGIAPFAVAGPSASFRLSCTSGGADCPSDTRSTDYGVNLGAGVRLGGRSGLTIEGRYSWGLRKLSEVTTGLDAKTRTFLALAGFEF